MVFFLTKRLSVRYTMNDEKEKKWEETSIDEENYVIDNKNNINKYAFFFFFSLNRFSTMHE